MCDCADLCTDFDGIVGHGMSNVWTVRVVMLDSDSVSWSENSGDKCHCDYGSGSDDLGWNSAVMADRCPR